ncbi:hypothetical protein QJQ45_004806 [Haematococcus lacustris]|nr:hypothetical protein QJQ45_004806 [Haematococcus lacustris]
MPREGMQQAVEALALNQLAKARLDSSYSLGQEQECRASQDGHSKATAAMCGLNVSQHMPFTRHDSLPGTAEHADCGAAPGILAPSQLPAHPLFHQRPHHGGSGQQAVQWDELERRHKVRPQHVQAHMVPLLTRGTGSHRVAGPASDSSRNTGTYSWSGPPASLAMPDRPLLWPAARDHWSGTDESTVAARLATQQLADLRDQALLRRYRSGPPRSGPMPGHSAPGQPFLLQSRTSGLPPCDDSYSGLLQPSGSLDPQQLDPYCMSPDAFPTKEEMLMLDGHLPYEGGGMREEQQAALQRLLHQQQLVDHSRQVYERQLAKQQQAYEELMQQQRHSEQTRIAARLAWMQQRQPQTGKARPQAYQQQQQQPPLPSVHEELQQEIGNDMLSLRGLHLPMPVLNSEHQLQGQRSSAPGQNDQPLWSQVMRQHSSQPADEADAVSDAMMTPARDFVASEQPLRQVSPDFMLTRPLPSSGLASVRSPGGQLHLPNLTRHSADIMGITLQPGDGNTVGSWLLGSDDDLSTLL